MMADPTGKDFTTCMTDQGFRSHYPPRVASQINYLIDQFGIPQYFDSFKRVQLAAFRLLSCPLPPTRSSSHVYDA